MLTLFLLVMFGLYFGFFTPTEAGAVGSLSAVLIGVVQRKLTWEGFVASIVDTLRGFLHGHYDHRRGNFSHHHDGIC